MLASLVNAFRVPEIRKKIFYTAVILIIYRIGSYITVPGVDAKAVFDQFSQQAGTAGLGLLSLLDLFSGGSLSKFAIFATNIGPYITASIVLQLLMVVIPSLDRLKKEGNEGKKKINQYTIYLAIVLAAFQAYTYMITLRQAIPAGFLPQLLIILSMVAGTALSIWLGGLITENGVGNGISLLIFTGIVARLPASFEKSLRLFVSGGGNFIGTIVTVIAVVALTIVVVKVEQAQRKIPVQYPKRVVGRKVYGGQNTHMPLKVNQAGVIPVIFASSVLAFLTSFGGMIPFAKTFFSSRLYSGPIYHLLMLLMIIPFTYFYTGITFDPFEVSDNMKKYGGFVPGIRPGRPTADYLQKISGRMNFSGAIYLGLVAITPWVLSIITGGGGTASFTGTSILIVVGVALDTMRSIESQLMMKQYEGFTR